MGTGQAVRRRNTSLGLTLASLLAVSAPAAAQTARISGTVTDQTGRVVQNPTLTLTNRATWERSNVTGDEAGRFEFGELEPGEYSFVASKPGFERLFRRFSLEAEEQREEEVVLRLGSIEETINVTDTNAPPPPPVTMSDDALARARENRTRGGTILPPIKIRDQSPVYPASVRGSGFEGKVVLDGLVRMDGTVDVLQILAPVDPATMTTVYPDLARTAVEAVGGWRYEPTLLHGVPVDTRITITVSFRP
ncbi:MAG: TonB family protein [Acidobacteria bacterium]|nr:TonB family protein [Acidobacteriota bacterium]MXZ72901.1 TonB family protein [Acidobacteriota bacterium]MYD70012.1 TonB family protein [Acidobacteriota bacterium]MYJ05406.1 TonB family protein [Acidobacteriota bacterium]